MVGLATARKQHAVNTASAVMSVCRRPKTSETEPMTNWPSADPTRKAVSVSCTTDADAPRSPAMSGNAGRYRSVDSEPAMAR
jgi:hypothetical protein